MTKTYSVQLSFAWWFKYYLHGVIIFCFIMQMEPNPNKFKYWFSEAYKIKVIENDAS